MIIEIKNIDIKNKGAEMMLLSIIEQCKIKYPEAKFVVSPLNSNNYEKKIQYGLYQKVSYRRFRIDWEFMFKLIPEYIRESIGMVLDSDVDVILDASGFAYSDQWGTYPLIETSRQIKKWEKSNKKVILMPQAFGPFKIKENSSNIISICNNADKTYARDEKSLNYLLNIPNIDKNKISLMPDFTNILKPIMPEKFDDTNHKVCIVPNKRILDKSSSENKNEYIEMLSICLRHLYEHNQKPFFLIHEGEGDFKLAEKIIKKTGINVPIVKEDNPLVLKGIISLCKGMIGSRFHGVVSALSQGVVSISIGWSHKYEMLHENYNFQDGLLEVTIDKDKIFKKLEFLINDELNSKTSQMIKKISEKEKEKTLKMWNEIFEVIN